MGDQQTTRIVYFISNDQNGHGFKDVMFLLLDICISLSQIAHSLYAMSKVDLATHVFLGTNYGKYNNDVGIGINLSFYEEKGACKIVQNYLTNWHETRSCKMYEEFTVIRNG